MTNTMGLVARNFIHSYARGKWADVTPDFELEYIAKGEIRNYYEVWPMKTLLFIDDSPIDRMVIPAPEPRVVEVYWVIYEEEDGTRIRLGRPIGESKIFYHIELSPDAPIEYEGHHYIRRGCRISQLFSHGEKAGVIIAYLPSYQWWLVELTKPAGEFVVVTEDFIQGMKRYD